MRTKFPEVIGTKSLVRLRNGRKSRVIMLNNAATTPPFRETAREITDYLQTYSALHRGAGPHANITYHKAEDAINMIKRFLNIRSDQSLLFTSNTSAAINLFSRLLKLKKGDIMITSLTEHTSNNLPWLCGPNNTVYVDSSEDGTLNYEELDRKASENSKNLKVIAITGASNLTGYIPDLKRISSIAHKYGALFFVDAAQLAPHRKIDIKASGIDALAFSAHKLYAPFGLGVLALPTTVLETLPTEPGGGSIDMISNSNIVWAPAAIRHQAGTWNVTGIIATAASCKVLKKTGWDRIVKHEQELVQYAIRELATVPGIHIYIPAKAYGAGDRIGTFPFNLKGYHHALLAAILENEYGIETRAGTICNHKLVRRWVRIDDKQQNKIESQIKAGNRLASTAS